MITMNVHKMRLKTEQYEILIRTQTDIELEQLIKGRQVHVHAHNGGPAWKDIDFPQSGSGR